MSLSLIQFLDCGDRNQLADMDEFTHDKEPKLVQICTSKSTNSS